MKELGLNPSEEELQDLVNEADLNKDGVISFEGRCLPSLSARIATTDPLARVPRPHVPVGPRGGH